MKNFKHPLDENFSYGYDGELYNLRSSAQSIFECHYQRAKYWPYSFKQECVNVCAKISDYAATANRVPTVLLSGGLDSEIVVRAFIESGKEFRTITHKFDNDLNQQEITAIEQFCSLQGIIPNYRSIDIEEWLISDDAAELAEQSKCVRPEMLHTAKLLTEVWNEGGLPVLGNGDLYLSKEINPSWRMDSDTKKYVWTYIEYEYILAWMRYCSSLGITGAINFFQQTPEIVLAMATETEIQELVDESPVGKQSSRTAKYQVYKKYWPDIVARPKYHGGEKISSLCDYLQKSLLNIRYVEYTEKWKKPFDQFVKDLAPHV